MKKLFAFAMLFIMAAVFCSWGFLAHRTTVQLAVYQLPKNLQAFFHAHMEPLVKTSVRPDERRNSDATEAPKHFIDFEVYGDSAAWKMPYDWELAQQQLQRDTLVKYGYLPYWIITMQQKLTDAFRAGNKDSILFYAADLAHYIADAHVPLHTSVNYDGQLTNQKGLHALWESTVPELELANYNLYARHRAKYISNKEAKIWDMVRSSFQMLPRVFEAEIKAGEGFTDSTKFRTQMRNGRAVKSFTSAFARAYAKQLDDAVQQRLLESSRAIADMWYTAWVDAGRPRISNFFKTPYPAAARQQLKKEFKSYKKNHLLQDSLLIARKRLVLKED